MKKASIFLLLAVAAFAAYWFLIRKSDSKPSGEKQAAIAVKKHSDKFNTSVANMMTAYFGMQNAFIDADTLKVKENCNKFIALVDSVDFNELKDDSAAVIQNAKMFFSDAKANAASLLTQKEILEMRKDFSMISESLYPAFKSINYTGATIYWQNCPMAFGEDKPANWISSTKEIMNPYMGKNHPEFKGTMLHCGEVKETLEGK
ncbi:MAG: DUF3347 domain-containing protein [Ferruginibacter sp.]|nr:DUF3347 domain-containing protein [Ferruginibacter sp.]